MFTKPIAAQLTRVKTYIPDNLLNFFSRTRVMIAPRIEAIGSMPIRIDWAINLSKEIPY